MSVFDALQCRHGVTVGQVYGATEIGSVTFGDPRESGFDPASVGRAMRGVELQIDDAGELSVRAASMFDGYVGEPRRPAGSFFHTGDLATLQDATGNLTLLGRSALIINVGGRKVNPLEVEAVLERHPQVGRCVVVPAAADADDEPAAGRGDAGRPGKASGAERAAGMGQAAPGTAPGAAGGGGARRPAAFPGRQSTPGGGDAVVTRGLIVFCVLCFVTGCRAPQVDTDLPTYPRETAALTLVGMPRGQRLRSST